MHDFIPQVADLQDAALAARLQHLLDHKTKPLGSLGRIEVLARQIGLILGSEQPVLQQPQMVVFAGDHGLAARGVSAFPAEVTAQMVANFLGGGAAVSVLARQHGLALTVVDAGVASALPAHPGLIDAKVAPGTADCSQEPAMSAAQCEQALRAGADVVRKLPGNALLLGEMGIGNTSSASLLMARLTGQPLTDCVGRGTGLDRSGLERKLAVLQEALQRHADVREPLAVLAAFGGFEVAMMVGAILQARRAPRHRGRWLHRQQRRAGRASLAAERAATLRVLAPVGRERPRPHAVPPGRRCRAPAGPAPGRGLGRGPGLAAAGLGLPPPVRDGQLRGRWREHGWGRHGRAPGMMRG